MAQTRTIAFQGHAGAYSDAAVGELFPNADTLPCASFEETFSAVRDGRADQAVIPIENSVAGRVADIHHLLPDSGLSIVGEHYARIAHCLLAPPGATLDGLTSVHSHIHALGQCRAFITEQRLTPVVHADTAGAAADIAAAGDTRHAAIASRLAAERYGLSMLAEHIEDADHNTTRFLIMRRAADRPNVTDGPAITSFVFRARSVPAALYKALGGFATNGVNITKLESYVSGPQFTVAQFYVDVEGHPDEERMQHAFEELSFFSDTVTVLGVYPAHPFRQNGK